MTIDKNNNGCLFHLYNCCKVNVTTVLLIISLIIFVNWVKIQIFAFLECLMYEFRMIISNSLFYISVMIKNGNQ